MLLAVAEGMVHRRVDEGSRSTVVSEVLLVVVDSDMDLRFAVVKVVSIGVVGKAAV